MGRKCHTVQLRRNKMGVETFDEDEINELNTLIRIKDKIIQTQESSINSLLRIVEYKEKDIAELKLLLKIKDRII
jgi:hypothetical protein